MIDEAQLHGLFPLSFPIKWNGLPGVYSDPKDVGLSQGFAESKLDYTQFGLKNHNGADLYFPYRTPILAPCDMYISWEESNDTGYGKFIFAETETKTLNGTTVKLEMVFGHHDENVAKPYKWYKQGDIIAYGDSTGFSTGHHLHFGIRPLIRLENGSWKQMFQDNGYRGYVDPLPFMPQVYRTIKEYLNTNDYFMEKNDKKLIFNNDTGEIGWLYQGKLQVPNKDRLAEMLASYLVRKEGVNVNKDKWEDLEKVSF